MVRVDADEVTNPTRLMAPLRALAKRIGPAAGLVDCGGAGRCGPSSLLFLLDQLGIRDYDQLALRREVADYFSNSGARRFLTLGDEAAGSSTVSLRDLAVAAMRGYSAAERRGCAEDAAGWAELVVQDTACTDLAFLAVAADLFQVIIRLTTVDQHGKEVAALCVELLPCGGARPRAMLEMAAVANQHFVARVHIRRTAGGGEDDQVQGRSAQHQRRRPASQSPPPSKHPRVSFDKLVETREVVKPGGAGGGAGGGSQARRPSEPPLRTLDELQSFLQARRPTHLVACEFSGAVRDAVDQATLGYEACALSVDVRESDQPDGAHFVGDVRVVVQLCERIDYRFRVVYLFPPCTMQLRADANCLGAKIADGRAWWGVAFVLWCWCLTVADAVVVEQSDTIFSDFYRVAATEGSKREFRTSEYGDTNDKYVRLLLRNVDLPARTSEARKESRPGRSQFDFPSPDARDRARSTWRLFPKVSAMLANADVRTGADARGAPLYKVAVEQLALEWCGAGHPLPIGYDDPQAEPPTEDGRLYQKVHGPGDLRSVDLAVPKSLGMPPARPQGARSAAAQAWLSGQQPESHALVRIAQRGGPGGGGGQSGAGEDSEDDCASLPGGDDGCTLCEGSGFICNEPGTQCPVCDGDGEFSAGRLTMSLGQLGGEPPRDGQVESVSATGAGANEGTLPGAIDIAVATDCAAVLLCVCVLVQPLVYAHVNGFTVIGMELPQRTSRATCMQMVQTWVPSLVAARHVAFMIGEYVGGARLFALPVDAAPPGELVVRTPQQRVRQLAAGAGFMWCTLAALQGTPMGDAAARAHVAVDTFVKPMSVLADAPAAEGGLEFRFGATKMQSVIRQPLLDHEDSPPAWRALARMARGDRMLIAAIAAEGDDSLLDGWAERTKAFDVGSIPPEMLSNLPDFSDARLEAVPLARVAVPISTAWLALPPLQEGAPAGTPACPRPFDMMLPKTQAQVRAWLHTALEDLVRMRDELAAGVAPEEIRRESKADMAIGQTEMWQWARGRVWDCRAKCCIVADFHEEVDTHLDRDLLQRRLHTYPDQALVSNLLLGVRHDADTELQTVFIRHLGSLANGYASVQKELHRMHDLGWFDFFPDFPYWPMYCNGKGSQARKLEMRYRPTTEGGGPRKETLDRSGLAAISINEASRRYHMPQHFLLDHRPEFQAWLRERGLPRATPELEGRKFSKYPRERKPQLEQVMRDLGVHLSTGDKLDAPVYIFGDDAKDYFPQLVMAASERHKQGVIFLAGEGDLPRELGGTGAPRSGGDRLIFVSEKRLGFGTHGASNIAQRFSDAILDMFREDMDEAEADAGAERSAAEDQWMRRRMAVQEATGEACQPNRRWQQAGVGETPLMVCAQQRLYSVYMYTDDPIFIVVGCQRTIRALRVWRRLTDSIGLVMAIPEKRTLGGWAPWIGVAIVAALGLIIVPRDKVLRAAAAIADVLEDKVEFHIYRSLCGLLEHIRAVNLRGRNHMHGLYHPHNLQLGPADVVTCTPLMKQQLGRWRQTLHRSCGVSVKAALLRDELEPSARVLFEMSSDACYADVTRAGVGGFLHGIYWYFEVPEGDRPILSIPILEFLGVCFNVLVFHRHLAAVAADELAGILLRTDALTAALTLPAESESSPLLIAAFQALRVTTEWQNMCGSLRIAHLFGDCNPFSDLVSRAKWREFRQLCAQFGIKPVQEPMPVSCQNLYDVVMVEARERHRLKSANELGQLGGTVGNSSQAAAMLAAATSFGAAGHGSPHRLWLALRQAVYIGDWKSASEWWALGRRQLVDYFLELAPVRDDRRVYAWAADLDMTIAWAQADEAAAAAWALELSRAFWIGWAVDRAWAQAQEAVAAEWAAELLRAIWIRWARELDISHAWAQADEAAVDRWAADLTREYNCAERGFRPAAHVLTDWLRTDISQMWVRADELAADEWAAQLTLRYDCTAQGFNQSNWAMSDWLKRDVRYTWELADDIADHPDPPSPARWAPPSPARWSPAYSPGSPTSPLASEDERGSDGEEQYAEAPASPAPTAVPEAGPKAPTAPEDLLKAAAQFGSAGSTFIERLANRKGEEANRKGEEAKVQNEARAPATATAVEEAGAPSVFVERLQQARQLQTALSSVSSNLRQYNTPLPGFTTPITPYVLPASPTRRRGSGLPMPTMPPSPKHSRLAAAGAHFAQRRAVEFQGEGDMALGINLCDMADMSAAVQEAVEFGVNSNTRKMDERAWLYWEHVCATMQTNPLRTADNARDRADVNAHLLAVLMLYAFTICKPKDKKKAFIKPSSALAYPLAIVRIFSRWGVQMPSYKLLKATLGGLLRLYIAYHGPYSLAPRRAEPMKFSMMRQMASIKGKPIIAKIEWSSEVHVVFMFERLNIIMMYTAMRLAEVVQHSSGEIMYLTFESLTWRFDGVAVVDPTREQLLNMRPGRDQAALAPARSKPDQWGEVHCPFPITFTLGDEPCNPAAALRDIELRCGCHGEARRSKPLFHDEEGKPFTHSQLDKLLRAVLTHLHGEAVGSVFTWHSYRAGLATALHAAGVPDEMIMLACRWMCPESLHSYRRVGTKETERHIRKAATMAVDAIQATNVVRVSNDEGYASIVREIIDAPDVAAEKEYQRALTAATGETMKVRMRAQNEVVQVPETTPTKSGAATAQAAAGATKMFAVGSTAIVPRAIWPTDQCDEGDGWEVKIVSRAKTTAMVAFQHACTSEGQPYEDVRLPLVDLREAPTK